LDYAASRFGRLYSVIVPAFLLTAASNLAVALKDPSFGSSTDYSGATLALSYVGTFFLLNHFWLWPLYEAPNAIAFWSLSAEVAYYAAIAILVFTSGYARWLTLAAISLFAGPLIVSLAPIWFLGYWTYHHCKRSRLDAKRGLALWLASLLLLPLCFLILRLHGILDIPFLDEGAPQWTLMRYAEGVCFAANLIGFNAIAGAALPVFSSASRTIRWLASLTFALYLFHFPLLRFFKVYAVGEPNSFSQALWMLTGTFGVVATLGYFCERSKDLYKKWFLSLWRRSATATVS